MTTSAQSALNGDSLLYLARIRLSGFDGIYEVRNVLRETGRRLHSATRAWQ